MAPDLQDSGTARAEPFRMQEVQLIVHIDGGSRRGDCSGSAWLCEVIATKGDHRLQFPVQMSGTFFSYSKPAFQVEVHALDEALQFVVQFVLPNINAV